MFMRGLLKVFANALGCWSIIGGFIFGRCFFVGLLRLFGIILALKIMYLLQELGLSLFLNQKKMD